MIALLWSTGGFSAWILDRFALWVVLILSLTVHEWAHAAEARRLGDTTAEAQGRLSLDPLVHLDAVGTVLLPFLGVPFGWAKPVPVEPLRFRRDVSLRWGLLRTAAAGPLSNLAVAALTGGLWWALDRLSPGAALPTLLARFAQVNLALALFNMLPIPPLDGSRVVAGLLPEPWASRYARLGTFGTVVAVLIVSIVVGALGFD